MTSTHPKRHPTISAVTSATTPKRNGSEKWSAMAGVKAWGSCMPKRTNTTELMRNTMMRQKLRDTSWRWAMEAEVRRWERSAMMRPAATTARMPEVPSHSANRYTKNGENTS